MSTSIWQPNLRLYNTDIDATLNEHCKDAECIINSTGMVQCIPPCAQEAKCVSSFKRWPFDKQNCSMHIGTWISSSEEIDFNSTFVYVAGNPWSQNNEWKMIQTGFRRLNPASKNNTYPTLLYSFLIQRHSAGHAAIILIPAICM